MQILIPCHACAYRKRPLDTCPACHAKADLDRDVSAWRLALHANHLARITAEPARASAADRVRLRPIKLTVNVRDQPAVIAPEIASVEPLFQVSGPRSFDWDESRSGRLRRGA